MILGIYGSGGLGREVLGLARQINTLTQRWSDVVFVEDSIVNGQRAKARAVSFAEAKVEFLPADFEICIAVGEPSIRAGLHHSILESGYKMATLIHPNVNIPADVSIGPGSIVCSRSFISCGVSLGENVLLQPAASIGHDCKVGSHSVISTFVSLGGNCTIGARTFIGMNVPVKESTTIGDDVIVGMGSAVLRNIEDGMVALGNPARPMSVNASRRVFGK